MRENVIAQGAMFGAPQRLAWVIACSDDCQTLRTHVRTMTRTTVV
jgi:hypothetical protein